jgi:hypothetical protein
MASNESSQQSKEAAGIGGMKPFAATPAALGIQQSYKKNFKLTAYKPAEV